MIIFLCYIYKITVNIHDSKCSKGERTLKIFKLSNNDQNLEVPDDEDRLRVGCYFAGNFKNTRSTAREKHEGSNGDIKQKKRETFLVVLDYKIVSYVSQGY